MKKPILLCSVLLLVAAPALAQDLPLREFKLSGSQAVSWPPQWEGIWEVTVTELDCSSGFELRTFTTRDTLCGEIAFHEDWSCDGDLTPETFSVQCTYTSFQGGTCTLVWREARSARRTDDTLSGSGFQVWDSSCDPRNGCTDLVFTGTRVEGCGTPVEPQTWSGIKSRYGGE